MYVCNGSFSNYLHIIRHHDVNLGTINIIVLEVEVYLFGCGHIAIVDMASTKPGL